jgi:hypothetical protein
MRERRSGYRVDGGWEGTRRGRVGHHGENVSLHPGWTVMRNVPREDDASAVTGNACQKSIFVNTDVCGGATRDCGYIKPQFSAALKRV